jgi:hypothetical protein
MKPMHAASWFCFLQGVSLQVAIAQTELPPKSPAQVQESSQAVPLPDSIDLRASMEQWGLTRRTQGPRPTCSVFTVTTALEFGLARRDGSVPRLSVEFLNWAGDQVASEKQDGGFFSDLWKGFVTHGICTESELAYRTHFDTNFTPSAALQATAKGRLAARLELNWIKEWDVNTGLTPAQLVEIKRTLSRGWPVCGGFRWPKKAEWVEGTLQMCPPDSVYDGHSVLLVGYRDDEHQPKGGVFLFRNTSGDGRDGAMSFAYALAYMNDAAWIGTGAKPSTPGATNPPASNAQ